MPAEEMIIDRHLPEYQANVVERLVVCAGPEATLEAARGLDFMTVRTPLVDAAMWARALPDKLRGRQAPPRQRLRLADGDTLPGWLMLGTSKSEIAFGAVGKFWKSSIEWRDVDPGEFAGFDEPGWGKIAANFAVQPYGDGRSLLTYECRTATTDEASSRRFGPYWACVRPFVTHIMRATVETIGTRLTQPEATRPMTSAR